MSVSHDRIAAFCRSPQTIDAICEHAKCNKVVVYNLVARGLLQNIGNKRYGRYVAIESKAIEPERTWREQPQIVQASSVWHYAQRMGASA